MVDKLKVSIVHSPLLPGWSKKNTNARLRAVSRTRRGRLMIHGDRPVIITMIPMWMMQVVVNQVVNVITVGNGLM
jgi:hypothetical protein